MISYHPNVTPQSLFANQYAYGFKTVDTKDMQRIANGIQKYAWSPIIWKEGRRKQSAFEACDLCVLDFDTPEMSLKEALKIFCDCIHIIGITKSHQKLKGGVVCDRFRVVLPFSEQITDLRVFRWNMVKVTDRYPCDKACRDGARFYYPCSQIISVSTEGYVEDVRHDVPEAFSAPLSYERMEVKINAGILPQWTRTKLASVIPMGERNTTWYRVAKDLTRFGLPPKEIVARIIASPTYRNEVTPELFGELQMCCLNGIKKALEELHDERERYERSRARED